MITTLLATLAIASATAQPTPEPQPQPTGAARALIQWVVQTMAEPPDQAAADILERATPDFQKAVPLEALQAQFQQLHTAFFGDGPIRIERYDTGETDHQAAALIRSDATRTPMRITLVTDETGQRIAGMNSNLVAVGGKLDIHSWDDLDAHLATLHGTVSLAAMAIDDDHLTPVHLYEPDAKLAIGSAFKLYVLGALAELIQQDGAAWDEQLPIDEATKSLPSGVLQNEPAGTTHDIAHFADLMISISDNTATDHLIERVGRTRVEDFMARHQDDPAKTIPFLKTKDMFTIKLCGDPNLADRYAAAGPDERRRMLETDIADATIKPWLVSAWAAPVHIDDIEWFATTPELCRAMLALHDLEAQDGLAPVGHALRLNPGMTFMTADWSSVAYKGGSEPGVLNLTWLLQRADANWYTLAITWNSDKPVDLLALLDTASEAISLLHQTP